MRAYLERVGLAFDIAVNVLFGGELGQTISYRAAVAARDGRGWARWFCRLLSVVVQRDHCALQLNGSGNAPLLAYIRAAVAVAVAVGIVAAVAYSLVKVL